MARLLRFRLVALALLLTSFSAGCRMLGMRSAPPGYLEERYESSESRYVTIDGTKIHYRIEGNPNGPTLVLLHGVLASLHTWDGWVERLGGTYRIVRMDLPGFGLSGPLANKDYTPEYAVEFFEMARQELNLDHFYLAGNSLGGFISWYYAAKYPQHVEKLILIDPIAYPQKLPRIIKFASSGMGGWMAELSSPRFIVKKNIKQVYGNPDSVTEDTVNRYHDLLLAPGHRTAMVEYFRTLKKYSKDEELCQNVKKVQAPTLLMWGGKDRWVPPELIERWRQDIQGLQVRVYDEGGHIPMEEFPEATARDAAAFLGDELPASVAAAPKTSNPRTSGSEKAEGAPPAWGVDESGSDVAAQAEEPPPPPPAPAAAPKKPAKQEDSGMVGWGEYGEM